MPRWTGIGWRTTAPYIYRTHDGGKTWTKISNGIPEGAFVNSVKEDPKVKGLLYAATELRVYVSFNDGDHWQPLQLNMPATSVRDMIVHGDDLDIATHGRGFWVLDQMSALRQLAEKGEEILSSPAYLFKPGTALALVPGAEDGTPLPPEEPQEKNPPGGVLAYYWLKAAATTPLKLELLDSKGEVRACAASDTPVKPVDTEKIDVQATLERAGTASGGDCRHASLRAELCSRAAASSAAVRPSPPRTMRAPAACRQSQQRRVERGAGVLVALEPGDYTVRLSVDGKTYTQPAVVAPDPRGAHPYDASADDNHK